MVDDEHPNEKRERLEDVGDRQYGLFSLDQALQCGMNRTTVYRRVRLGRYDLEFPGVFSFAGVPASWERTVLAACLAAGDGAVASHRTAARIWGLVPPGDDIVEITVPRARRLRPKRVTIHRLADLTVAQTTVRRRIPVTNPLRTIVDLAAVLAAEDVEDAIDTGLAPPSLFSIRAIEATRDELSKQGRHGTGVLAAILDERALGNAVNDSKLESCMARLLRRAGLPAARFHHVIRTPAGVFLAEVDFAYPEVRLAIEVDGFEKHGTPRAMAKDFVRQNGLVRYGWHVLRFTWRQVVREPEMVARTIAASLAGLAAA
jgi:very-short-patch-repair endonuclease